MRVRKGLILAAGYGTRMLPVTKASPKEMLPLVDKPVIHYVVEEAVASGIEQIILVTSGGKRAVENYFDYAPALERALEEKGDLARRDELRGIAEMVEMVFVRQKEQKGIGHAVLAAESIIGDEPFVLYFPDDIIVAEPPATRQLIDVYDRHDGCVLAVEQVPHEEISHYGSMAVEPLEDDVFRVKALVEKPKPEDAPSDLGVVGRYVLTPDVFAALHETKPGIGGEIQITDGLALLLKTHPIFAYRFQGKRYDTGRPLGLLQASLELMLRRPDLGPHLREYLKSLDLS
ncbi:MAG: UTP--glucose-1-phosphate uridylyltransferase GalU [Dehalococcoidia bacterium]|jgi:UTP--glucose-1-phosphate uridylyltransferase